MNSTNAGWGRNPSTGSETLAQVVTNGNDLAGTLGVIGNSVGQLSLQANQHATLDSANGDVRLFSANAGLIVTNAGKIQDQNLIMTIDDVNFDFSVSGNQFLQANTSAPGFVGYSILACGNKPNPSTGRFDWFDLFTVQTGTPVGQPLTSLLIRDDTALTGGLYAWNGADYEQIAPGF